MAGGEGMRLRPLTSMPPKPLIDVGGMPLIERLARRLVKSGVERIFISVNYLGHMIEEHFDSVGLGVPVHYLRENTKLGTAGALSLLPEIPSGPVVVLNGEVALEQLMPEDPIMDDAEQLDLEPERIEPGQTLVTEEDAPFPGTTGSVVISYDCHEDSVVGGIETPGNIFATALVANISDGNLCEQLPTVVEEPQDLVVQEGDDAQFFIVATDPLPDGDFVLEWRHEGVVVEPDSDNVTISNVTQADAGLYACYMTNGCGRTVSRSAQLIVVPPPCDGDANGDRTVNGADLSVLLGQFGDSVTPGTGADFNASGDVNGADLSVLLGQFGTNCN